MPSRIQRRRTKGWRSPPGAIYVGRPSRWGNRFTPEAYWSAGYSGSLRVALHHCVRAYRAWLEGRKHWAHGDLPPPPDLIPLRGHDLVCWCGLCDAHREHGKPLGVECADCAPCHGDVLLEVSNA